MQCPEEAFFLNDSILSYFLSNLLQFKSMQGYNAEATAVTETPSPSRIQLTDQQPLDDKNVRGRGVVGDEEMD